MADIGLNPHVPLLLRPFGGVFLFCHFGKYPAQIETIQSFSALKG
jgi:hypothetical protein